MKTHGRRSVSGKNDLKSLSFPQNQVPVSLQSLHSSSRYRPRRIDLDLPPNEVAARCRHLGGLVFFDTARNDGRSEALSIIAAAPSQVVEGHIDRDWERLRETLATYQTDSADDDGLPHGFAAGWVEYDGRFSFGFYENALIFRHSDQQYYEVGDMASGLAEELPAARSGAVSFRSATTMERYCEQVRTAQRYIAAGDIYQVNLAHRFEAEWNADAWGFYETLRHYSPAPHCAFLDVGGRQVLSSSPECFLKMSGASICTRPIKGTRPRRSDPLADEKSAYDLITSPKEVAELVMITDLERNDLGRVCEYGSVTVSELLKLERYEQVFHLVSTVQGQLRPEIDQAEALRLCFPGGSISGAPKKRACEIIAEQETTPRGLYTGAIGWLGFNGESQFSIAIRTVVVEGDRAHFHVGAGIVADSIPEMEWQETLDKAAGIILAAERMEK